MTDDIYAYAFKTAMSMPQIFERLNDVGPWRWIERDSDSWGDYVAALDLPDALDTRKVKILADDDGRYVIDVVLKSDRPDARARFAEVREIVLQRVLPAIKAFDVAPTEHVE